MLIRYEIEYWNEIDEEDSTEKGLTSGNDFGEAVNRIVEYYGEDNVYSLKVYECEEVLCDEEIKNFFT